MPNVAMLHERDPKQEIIKKIGSAIDKFEILNNELLVAIYLRPEKTAGGIVMTRRILDEDKYQSKTGLVLKIGPTCDFPTLPEAKLKVGDWVIMRPSDTFPMDLLLAGGEMWCRMIYDKHVKARVDNPDLVW